MQNYTKLILRIEYEKNIKNTHKTYTYYESHY